METLALSLFSAMLIICIACRVPITLSLLLGFFIFAIYALRKGYRGKDVAMMAIKGMAGASNILIAFLLIGMLTASWRSAGTIPSIVCYAYGAMDPSWFLVASFLLNCLISFLTGTSFGSVATMGVICMTMGNALGISPVLSGGAILSGVFFGDRCSPVSTSALLVADITGTDIFRNIGGMMRTGAVPFMAALVIYAALSVATAGRAAVGSDLTMLLERNFRIGLVPLVPAALMLLLSLCKVSTRRTMAASTAAALAVAILYEGIPVSSIPSLLVFGYSSPDPELSAVINGGGIISMLNVAAIVAISSSYAGIFHGTGMLDGLRRHIAKAGKRVPSALIITAVSTATSMISCNQTLATMLTHQLCSDLVPDKEKMAISLENSVIVIAPLIPWSIAGSVPLAILGAPTSSLLAAFYLFLLPLWMMISGSPEAKDRKEGRGRSGERED